MLKLGRMVALLVISDKGELYVGPGSQEELAIELKKDSQKCYLLVFPVAQRQPVTEGLSTPLL